VDEVIDAGGHDTKHSRNNPRLSRAADDNQQGRNNAGYDASLNRDDPMGGGQEHQLALDHHDRAGAGGFCAVFGELADAHFQQPIEFSHLPIDLAAGGTHNKRSRRIDRYAAAFATPYNKSEQYH